MSKHELFNSMVDNISGWDDTEEYSKLLDFYDLLNEEERQKIDVSKLHEKLLLYISNAESDFEIVSRFSKYDAEFKEKAEEKIKKCRRTKIICQYMEATDIDDEEFVELAVRAASAVMPEHEEEIEALARVKKLSVEKGLYDNIIDGIKTSGHIETVVYAALCFENQLIDDVFGGKQQMFMYLSAANFVDEDSFDHCIERLLVIDSGQLRNEMEEILDAIDEKILEKKL